MKQFVTLSLLLVLNNSILSACSCVTLNTDTLKRIAGSDVIVSGTIVSKSREYYIDPSDTSLPGRYVVYRMVVAHNYGEGPFADTIEIVTGTGDGDCGYAFVPGRKYIVFPQSRRKKFWKRKRSIQTSICTLTAEYSEEFHNKIVSVKLK